MERNQAARRLLAEWMADEAGYDEQVWPTVERLIEEHPVFFAVVGIVATDDVRHRSRLVDAREWRDIA